MIGRAGSIGPRPVYFTRAYSHVYGHSSIKNSPFWIGEIPRKSADMVFGDPFYALRPPHMAFRISPFSRGGAAQLRNRRDIDIQIAVSP